MDTIQVTENELFEIIGRSTVEIFAKDKELAAYRGQFEKVKTTLLEAEALKAKNVALEVSNKSLAEKNIQLDQALTEARKERESLRVAVASKDQLFASAQKIIDAKNTELAVANKALDAARSATPTKKSKR